MSEGVLRVSLGDAEIAIVDALSYLQVMDVTSAAVKERVKAERATLRVSLEVVRARMANAEDGGWMTFDEFQERTYFNGDGK